MKMKADFTPKRKSDSKLAALREKGQTNKVVSELKSSRFGQYVTYYHHKEGTVITGPDLSKLVLEQGFKDFSRDAITSFLTFRYPIGSLTMFSGYKRVPFGTEIVDGETRVYWQPRFSSNTSISFESAVEQAEDILIEAVKGLTQGKKAGVAVSGGLDSSLIVALIRKIYPQQKIYTYSVGFYGDDEFEYSRIVARQFKTEHREKVLNKQDYIGEQSLLRPLIKHKAEPLHPNEIALAEAERLARADSCDVVLCGEGADDIFGGYGQNLCMYVNYRKDRPFFDFFLDNYRYFSIEDRKKIIKDEYLVDDLELLGSVLNNDYLGEDLKDSVFYFTQKVHTPGLITRGTNAMSFNGFEPAFPYLDDRLVDFVNSLPFDFKVHWKSEEHQKQANGMHFREVSEKLDIPKYILKKLAEKYLPRKIIYRPKYGFPVPFKKWFGNLKQWSLEEEIFKTNDISQFNGWKKFMIINLNTFIEEFRKDKR